jgi:hypothetical protein
VGDSRLRFTMRWFMARVVVLAFPFLILRHVGSWSDWGPLIVLIATYVGMEVALRPYRDASGRECEL